MYRSMIKQGLSDPGLALWFIRDRIERRASKLIFKNTSGVTNNIKGYITFSKIKKINFDYQKTPKSSISEEFVNKGYVKIGFPYRP